LVTATTKRQRRLRRAARSAPPGGPDGPDARLVHHRGVSTLAALGAGWAALLVVGDNTWPSSAGSSVARGSSTARLISYILFEPAFHEEIIALGRSDAHRWLERVTGPDAPWVTQPIDSLPDS